ncbi:MAG: hypothetical protein GY710_02125 [Desulfobacteraceae bacterium]|nr:hypothetical protein [Desulfobacteraceae bacterium]
MPIINNSKQFTKLNNHQNPFDFLEGTLEMYGFQEFYRFVCFLVDRKHILIDRIENALFRMVDKYEIEF